MLLKAKERSTRRKEEIPRSVEDCHVVERVVLHEEDVRKRSDFDEGSESIRASNELGWNREERKVISCTRPEQRDFLTSVACSVLQNRRGGKNRSSSDELSSLSRVHSAEHIFGEVGEGSRQKKQRKM